MFNFFNPNDRQLKKLYPLVEKITEAGKAFMGSSDSELVAKTVTWKGQVQALKSDEAAQDFLSQILPEAFALVKEAAGRTLGMRHFDVQLMAGIVLHQGKIAEQKTGEGKTLTATLPLYLNALLGLGAHLITPNDYLSKRDAGWMGRVFDKLGLSVGAIVQQKAFLFDPKLAELDTSGDHAKCLREVTKKQAYSADITYGTNHEFGFDYLRDNMVSSRKDIVQTCPLGHFGLHTFAIVDEVDSILIDVARTPLIIAANTASSTEDYYRANTIVNQLSKGTDFDIDEKYKSASLTELGIRRVEKMLGVSNLYEQDYNLVHLLEQALTAYALYEKDRDYVVKNNEVIIVDQFTGRLLFSNRFSHGLHQAIEAKEQVPIKEETQTVAEISYQNYFRMYKKLSGMTGTAITEAEEFSKIYNLDVVMIPTNQQMVRFDHNDVVYKTESGKFKAVADEIFDRYTAGQPVLVGTTSVEKSQLLHELLKRKNIPHQILNAKNHEEEAKIIVQAGHEKAVTISTNMAGRGVDIKLGGDPVQPAAYARVKDLGGLHVIGTERHDSRRIDNQLRGRSGRQGDPGSSRFYVSLQDDLMRIFGGAQVEKLMDRFGIDDTTPLESAIVSKAIENAQKKVEGFNFDRRKNLVEMDDVMNVHREVVYKLRRRILDITEQDETYLQWFLDKLSEYDTPDHSIAMLWQTYQANFGKSEWYSIIAQICLPVVDMLWMRHLSDMNQVRDGIGLRGYAQKDPMVEYKREGHERFEGLIKKIYFEIFERIVNIKSLDEIKPTSSVAYDAILQRAQYTAGNLETGVAADVEGAPSAPSDPRIVPVKPAQAVGRNAMCPCGSGKKYKNCGLINAPSHKN